MLSMPESPSLDATCSFQKGGPKRAAAVGDFRVAGLPQEGVGSRY